MYYVFDLLEIKLKKKKLKKKFETKTLRLKNPGSGQNRRKTLLAHYRSHFYHAQNFFLMFFRLIMKLGH